MARCKFELCFAQADQARLLTRVEGLLLVGLFNEHALDYVESGVEPRGDLDVSALQRAEIVKCLRVEIR